MCPNIYIELIFKRNQICTKADELYSYYSVAKIENDLTNDNILYR